MVQLDSDELINTCSWYFIKDRLEAGAFHLLAGCYWLWCVQEAPSLRNFGVLICAIGFFGSIARLFFAPSRKIASVQTPFQRKYITAQNDLLISKVVTQDRITIGVLLSSFFFIGICLLNGFTIFLFLSVSSIFWIMFISGTPALVKQF